MVSVAEVNQGRRQFFSNALGNLRAKAERGATLTGYALMVATMLTVSLAGIEILNDNSEDFLVESGSQIGQPRLYRDDAVTSVLPAPPGWAQPTAPPTLLTYASKSISTALGCIGWDPALTVFVTATCGSANEVSFSAQSGNGTDIQLSFAGGCIGADPAAVAPAPQIFPVACPSAPWTQLDDALPAVKYEFNGSGLCLGAVTPVNAGDPGVGLVPCTDPAAANDVLL